MPAFIFALDRLSEKSMKIRTTCRLVKTKVTPTIEPIRCKVRMIVSLKKSSMEYFRRVAAVIIVLVKYFRRASVIGNSNGKN